MLYGAYSLFGMEVGGKPLDVESNGFFFIIEFSADSAENSNASLTHHIGE